MTSTAVILSILGVLSSVGILAGGIGYLVGQFRRGTKQEKAESTDLIKSNDDIKQFYKEQNDDLKEINKVLSQKIEVLTREVGEIRGQLTAETAQRKEYQLIFENRDPETKKFNELVIKSLSDLHKVSAEMVRVLGEIHNMSKLEHDRDLNITATVTKQ